MDSVRVLYITPGLERCTAWKAGGYIGVYVLYCVLYVLHVVVYFMCYMAWCSFGTAPEYFDSECEAAGMNMGTYHVHGSHLKKSGMLPSGGDTDLAPGRGVKIWTLFMSEEKERLQG